MAYDGRGNYLIRSPGDISAGYTALGSGKIALYAERFVPFAKELAVMVVRGQSGDTATLYSYPTVETIQENNICKLVFAPAQIKSSVSDRAQAIARDVVAGLSGAGVYGVELFLLPDDSIVVNEIAPRPHNSGHYTIEACYTSQFENHIRAVVGLPIGCCDLKVGGSVMINILGSDTMQKTLEPCTRSLSLPAATVHLYGKSECRVGRKMGHITVCRDTFADARRIASLIEGSESSEINRALVGVIMGSDSDLSVMKAAAEVLEEFGVNFELTIVSAHRTPDRMMDYAKTAVSRGLKVIIAAAGKGIQPNESRRRSSLARNGCCADSSAGSWSSCSVEVS